MLRMRSPKVRSNTFNFYIVFCLGPDTLYFPLMFIINLFFLLDAMRVLATEDEYISIYTSQMAKVCMQLYAWSYGTGWSISGYPRFCGCRSPYSFKSTNFSWQTSGQSDTNPRHGTSDNWFDSLRSFRDHRNFGHVSVAMGGWCIVMGCELEYVQHCVLVISLFNTVHTNTDHNRYVRYRSLTMFFVRLLASAYLMAIGSGMRLGLLCFTSIYENKAARYSFNLCFLIGFVQVCLVLTKKDIRDAFVYMWCSRKRDSGNVSSKTTGGYDPENDSYDVESPLSKMQYPRN